MSIDIDSVKPGDSVRFASDTWLDPAHYGYSREQWVRVKDVPGDRTLTIEPSAKAVADEKWLPYNAGFGRAWFDDHRPADPLRTAGDGATETLTLSGLVAQTQAERHAKLTRGLAETEEQLDVALDVIGYALDKLDPANRERVLGYWDARLTD